MTRLTPPLAIRSTVVIEENEPAKPATRPKGVIKTFARIDRLRSPTQMKEEVAKLPKPYRLDVLRYALSRSSYQFTWSVIAKAEGFDYSGIPMPHSPYPTMAVHEDVTFTQQELLAIYTVARRSVSLRHPVFNAADIEWRVNPQFMRLEISTTANVLDRDSSPSYDQSFGEGGGGAGGGYGMSGGETREAWQYATTLVNISHIPKMQPLQSVTPVTITRAQAADPPTLLRVLAEAARNVLVRMVTHEVDELIMVDGERVFDPHAKERSWR